MKRKTAVRNTGILLLSLALFPALFFTACPQPASNLAVISSFVFPAADNDALSADVTATIDGTAIAAAVPYGTAVTALAATAEASAGATISPDPATAADYTSPVTFTVTADDGETTAEYTVTVTVAPEDASTEAAITSFVFAAADNASLSADVTGTISGTAIAATVPYSTDVTALVPTIGVSAGASVNPASGAAQDFTSAVTYTVTAEDAATTAAYTVTVTELDAVIVGGNVFSPLSLDNEVTTAAGAPGVAASFDGTGVGALMDYPAYGVAVGTSIYFSDLMNHVVRKLDTVTNTVTTLAGTPGVSGYAEGAPGTAQFNFPRGLAYDGTDLYVADQDNHAIRKISLADGSTELLAGGPPLWGFEDATGSDARFYFPNDLCYHDGCLYVADRDNNRIRKIDITTAEVTTLAGSGVQGHLDGTGAAAVFRDLWGITCDGTALWVATNFMVRKITLPDAVVTSPFGAQGENSYVDSTGTAARFGVINGIVAHDGCLYTAGDTYNRLRKLDTTTLSVQTLAGSTTQGVLDGNYTSAQFHWPYIQGIVGDYLYTGSSGGDVIRRTHLTDREVTTVAGSAGHGDFNDGTGVGALLYEPLGATTDGEFLYFGQYGTSGAVRKMDLQTLEVSSLPGSYGASFRPRGIVYVDGALYLCNQYNHIIQKIDLSTGDVSTFAGEYGSTGTTDGTGADARFNVPIGITSDGANLYVTDTQNGTIRKIVIATGDVTTFAGTAETSGSADGIGPAASFNEPESLTTDGSFLYVADTENSTIRKIDLSTAEVTTLAGDAGSHGFVDETGIFARFNKPAGIACDGTNLYVTDRSNHMVRKIVISTAAVTTVAGSATVNDWADGTGTAACFNTPQGIVCAGGVLWVMDENNHVIRSIE